MSIVKPGKVIRVAFADDHAAGRMGIAMYLEELGGISVEIQADNGKQLIEELEKAKTLPDICILDVNMPKMNGLDALKAIRTKWPAMKFLAMSAFPSEHLVIPMIRNGAGGYLLKTCFPEEIKEALIAIYETGFYNSEFVSQKLRQTHVELTDDEMKVLKASCSEQTYKEIGAKLNKSPKSVDKYRDSLFRKLNIKTRPGLVLYAIQSGLVPIEELPNSQLKNSK
ncbi:MAG: response regulator transcription factor [Bacteroidetes bacterium]|nr:response regulator transcription factor [Bacteroidota bacterium]MBS1629347.1 response regulator transcription factor [Bacteroidota bacterium]